MTQVRLGKHVVVNFEDRKTINFQVQCTLNLEGSEKPTNYDFKVENEDENRGIITTRNTINETS